MPADDQYYYDLAYARAQQREVNEVKSEAGRVLKPPSSGLYTILYALAIIGDIADIGGPLTDVEVDIPINIVLFFAGRSAKNRTESMNQFQDGLHGHIENIEKKIVAYRNAYARALRTSRKIKILRKPVRKIALRLSRLRKSVARSPIGRTVAAIIADFVPLIELVPWRTINIYMMKRDEMRAFQESQNMLSEYMSAKADEIEAANDLQEAEMEEQAA